MPAMHRESIKVVKADHTFEAMQHILSDVGQDLLVNLTGRRSMKQFSTPYLHPGHDGLALK